MSNLEIRPLEPSDALQVHDLLVQPEVARALGGTPFDSPDAFERSFRGTFGPGGNDRLGAFEGATLVGFAELARSPRVRLSHSAQLTLAVRPADRRRGIGTALIQRLLDAADRWMHLVRIEVEVLAQDAGAQAFLAEHDFSMEVRRAKAIVDRGALVDTIGLARIRPGFTQAEGALRPMPTPPPRRPRPRGPVVIRPVRLDDAPSMARFSQDPTVLAASSQVPTLGADYWRRRLEGGLSTSWSAVILVDDELAACGNIHSFDSPRRRHALTLGMSVLSPYQGMGLGERLLTTLLEAATSWLGAERVELMVLADNTRAVRLYEKHGFLHEGAVRFDIWRDGGYADSFVMGRLSPRALPAG